MAPVIKMHTLGHGFIPAGIHAGGLRYHGVSPLISILLDQGYIEARAVKQLGVFEAATLFTKTEGILPAPESAHAIRTAVDLALEAKEKGEEKCILFGLSGHGHFDLASYELYSFVAPPRLRSPRGGAEEGSIGTPELPDRIDRPDRAIGG
jgi:tryptophan synthase beta chain